MATIYDVAKWAKVSPKTVSRVLNKDGAVKAATRERVERAMNELGYSPSSAARSMRSNKTGLVGLITGAISLTPTKRGDAGLPDLFIVQGIQKAIEASGKTLLIADTGGRNSRVPDLIRTFEQHRVEGLIYVADYHQQVSLPRLRTGTHLVLANCYDDAGTPAVLPHDYNGQRQLVDGLIERGHQRIAYLTLSTELEATRLRTAGYIDALNAADIPIDPDLIAPIDLMIPDVETETQLLWDALDRLLSLPDRPTVLCFGNDRMAMRAYGILRSRGLKLPEDVSIAGYDNYALITETLYPPLTSAELPYAAIGIRATRLLLSLIDGSAPAPTEPLLVSGSVHWRESVAEQPRTISKITSIGRK